jgi:hypothetical protein
MGMPFNKMQGAKPAPPATKAEGKIEHQIKAGMEKALKGRYVTMKGVSGTRPNTAKPIDPSQVRTPDQNGRWAKPK